MYGLQDQVLNEDVGDEDNGIIEDFRQLQQRAGARPVKVKVDIPKYDGKQAVADYLQLFEEVATLNRYALAVNGYCCWKCLLPGVN